MNRTRQPEIRDAELEAPQAEKIILGAFLNSETEFWNWYERLEDIDFTAPINQRVFRAMRALALQNRSLAPSIIVGVMEKGDTGDKSPGPYMHTIKGEARGVLNLDTFVEKVKECSMRRLLLKVSQGISELATKGSVDASADRLIEEAMALVGSASNQRTRDTLKSAGDVALTVVDQMIETVQGKRSSGLMTRLAEINELIGPLMPGEFIVLAGATSSGKTALMAQIMEDIAVGREGQEGVPVGMIQAEMTAEAVVRRWVAQRAGVPAYAIANGSVNRAEDEKVLAAAESMRGLPLHIDAERGISLSGMIAKARRLKRRHGIQMLIIDHVREIVPDRKAKGDNEFQHIADVVQASGNLAGELGIPVILGAQLKRDPASRDIKTAADIRLPNLGDVWGGSAIEQKADTVLFVHRPQYYLERAEPAQSARHYEDWQKDLDRWKGKAQLVVAKRRGGEGYGLREVGFIGAFTQFTSLRKADISEDNQEALEFT